MANNGFVFTNGPLPELKHDNETPPVDTSGEVVAADMNGIRSDLESLRAADLAGDFQGLRDMSGGMPPLSNPGEVRLASNAGALVASQNGGAYAAVGGGGGGGGMTALTGDVTGAGSGSVATTVAFVGGSTAANVHAGEQLANAATALNTNNTIVKRSSTGGVAVTSVTFPDTTVQTTAASSLTLAAVGSTPNSNAASVVSGVLNLQPADASNPGVLTTGAQTIAGTKTFSSPIAGSVTGSAASFTGSLAGNVTGTQGATVVASVGGVTAANVAAGANLANAATSANTASALVARDPSGNFVAGTITANLTGNASGSAASFTGSLVGDVTGTQGATVVSQVGGSTAANVHAAELLANAATAANIANTIVRRDSSGAIQANVTGSLIEVGGVTATALATPVNAAFTAGSGTLTAGTKYYRVSALWNDGETLASTETSITVGASSGVNVNWVAVAGATGYRIYGRTTGAELLLTTVGIVTTWLDDGSLTPSGALPTFNSTGGLSMPGNQTYTNPHGVHFQAPNADATAAIGFFYDLPSAWRGVNAAGYVWAAGQGGNPYVYVSTYGPLVAPSGVQANLFSAAAAGNNVTFAGANSDGGQQGGAPYGSANIILNSGNTFSDPSSQLVQIRNLNYTKSFFSNNGFLNGGVNALGLSVSQVLKPVFGTQAWAAVAGTLTAGTYYYRISALNANGETIPCAEKSFTLGSTGGVKMYWFPTYGATSYNIYGRTTGAETLLKNIDANDATATASNVVWTNEGGMYVWIDDGSISPSGAMPTTNTTAGVSGGFAIKALPAPVLRAFTSGSGTLVAATYYYKVSAVNDFGETLPSAEGSFVRATTGGVNINWQAVPGAAQYKIFGRTTGAELLIGTVDANTFTFLDNGSVTPSGAMATVNATGNCSTVGKWIDAGFTDMSGTPGNATQNSGTGKSAIANGASSVTITNNLLGTNSIPKAWVFQASADATLLRVERTSVSGSTFTIYGNANATAAVTVAWEILN